MIPAGPASRARAEEPGTSQGRLHPSDSVSMPIPRFVYFDIDDTLLDHRQAERAALADVVATYRAQFAPHPLEDVQARYHTRNVALWRRYAAGTVSKEVLRRQRIEAWLEDLGIDLDAEAVGQLYMDRYRTHWSFIEGAREAFLTIADHLPVGLLTNGFAEVQHAKLDRFPELRARASAVVISEEVGVMKPHPQIFAHATRTAGTPPGAILYVGDSLHSDVEGGLQAGWQVAWFARNGATEQAPGAFRFADWSALLARLGLG